MGFGTAGIGIANLLLQLMQDKGIMSQRRRAIVSMLLAAMASITENGNGVRPEQLPYARKEGRFSSGDCLPGKSGCSMSSAMRSQRHSLAFRARKACLAKPLCARWLGM